MGYSVESFGEYLLGALGCINMILAMRKFEIQWTFCDYVAPVLEETGETIIGKRGSFLVLVATIFILGLPIRHQLYRGDYVLPLFIFLHFVVMRVFWLQTQRMIYLVFDQYNEEICESYEKQEEEPEYPWKEAELSLLSLPWTWTDSYNRYNNLE